MGETPPDGEHESRRLAILLAEYQACAEEHRHYSTLIWQVPAIGILVAGTLLAFTFSTGTEKLVRPFLAAGGLALVLVMTVALERYRVFEIGRRIDLERFETKEFSKYFPDSRCPIVVRGSKQIYAEVQKSGLMDLHWWNQYSAYNWLRGLMYGWIVLMIGVFVFTFIQAW